MRLDQHLPLLVGSSEVSRLVRSADHGFNFATSTASNYFIILSLSRLGASSGTGAQPPQPDHVFTTAQPAVRLSGARSKCGPANSGAQVQECCAPSGFLFQSRRHTFIAAIHADSSSESTGRAPSTMQRTHR